ncbi:hypothetical protein [Stenotrophomonas sp. CASM110]|uniref:hypothetical protein n=1 Tax=Stenotrophomonas sp. CASM110 TaxID=3111510 RepID=UPI003BF8ABC1
MSASNAEIARDIVVAVISHRDGYVDAAEAAKLYKGVLEAVGEVVRAEAEKDGY